MESFFMSSPLDLKSVQKEFATVSKTMDDLQAQLNKHKRIYSALYHLVKALGGDPGKAFNDAEDNEADKVPQTLPLGLAMTLPEVIKEAIPAAGKIFGIDDVLFTVRKRFPMMKREELSNILWRLSKQGDIRTVAKGKRGTPAQYVRA